jgi:hypothetical protein
MCITGGKLEEKHMENHVKTLQFSTGCLLTGRQVHNPRTFSSLIHRVFHFSKSLFSHIYYLFETTVKYLKIQKKQADLLYIIPPLPHPAPSTGQPKM